MGKRNQPEHIKKIIPRVIMTIKIRYRKIPDETIRLKRLAAMLLRKGQ